MSFSNFKGNKTFKCFYLPFKLSGQNFGPDTKDGFSCGAPIDESK